MSKQLKFVEVTIRTTGIGLSFFKSINVENITDIDTLQHGGTISVNFLRQYLPEKLEVGDYLMAGYIDRDGPEHYLIQVNGLEEGDESFVVITLKRVRKFADFDDNLTPEFEEFKKLVAIHVSQLLDKANTMGVEKIISASTDL